MPSWAGGLARRSAIVRVRTLSCAPGIGDWPNTSLGVAGEASVPGTKGVNFAVASGAAFAMDMPVDLAPMAGERSDVETVGANWRTGSATLRVKDSNARLPASRVGAGVVVVGGGVVVCAVVGS